MRNMFNVDNRNTRMTHCSSISIVDFEQVNVGGTQPVKPKHNNKAILPNSKFICISESDIGALSPLS